LRKNQKNTVPLDMTDEPLTENMQEQQEGKAKIRYLLQKIKELGEPDATIIVQKYYFGRSMREIAEMTGLKSHTAQVRCGRALRRLRKEMEQWR
jgi:RNA polymerase sigma-70 factor (ECF subfamily)